MLLLPEHLTVVPWRYLTVRIISKWNEMYPDLQLAPNIHQCKAVTTEFVAVGIGHNEYNRLVVWGLKTNYQAGFRAECDECAQRKEWIEVSQMITDEDYPAFDRSRNFLQFARHEDVRRWLRDRKQLARSKSETAAELRKMLPDLEFRESILSLMK